tara:strand:- start:315 stop:1100 length:786 start_codon:yes stop_codon:yes gene_type:complete
MELVNGDFVPEREDVVASNLILKDVGFGYPERENIFTGLNLEIAAGKTLGVVGSTGSGKTTLVRLLLRFADVNDGEIEWVGENIKTWDLKSLRSSIALVDQHITLFPTTILENIRYGKPEADDVEVKQSAVIAEASEFIEKLPNGWETMIGEGGHRLSGGQRQRLAIARAVLKDAPLMILDEATSAVDNETEAALQRSIEKVSKDRTTIIIAHRLSTIRNSDRIIVLDNGVIMEDGSHEDLISKKGIYNRMWSVQTGVLLN